MSAALSAPGRPEDAAPVATSAGTRRVQRFALHAIPAISLAVALLVIALLLASAGIDPTQAADILLTAALGSPSALGTTAVKVCPVLVIALGVAIAMRANRWNLGTAGQMYAGAIGAVAVAVYVMPGAPGALIIPASLIASLLGGALWILLPVVLRATRGITELITSLLLNFVALDLVIVLVEGPFGSEGASTPESPAVPGAAMLGKIWPDTQAHVGLLIALGFAAVVAFTLNRTNVGFEFNAVGQGEGAARAAGIRTELRGSQALLASGALAGLAGGIEVLAVSDRLVPGLESGYGFVGIAVALLGQGRVLGIIGASCFFGVLLSGAPALNFSLGVAPSVVSMTEGLAITGVVVGYGVQLYFRRRQAARGVA